MHKMKPNQKWRQQFDSYLKSMPVYYGQVSQCILCPKIYLKKIQFKKKYIYIKILIFFYVVLYITQCCDFNIGRLISLHN